MTDKDRIKSFCENYVDVMLIRLAAPALSKLLHDVRYEERTTKLRHQAQNKSHLHRAKNARWDKDLNTSKRRQQ